MEVNTGPVRAIIHKIRVGLLTILIMAFVHECRIVANCWLRPGNSYTTNNFLSLPEGALENLF